MLPLIPPATIQQDVASSLPCDAKDHQPLLLGACTRAQILAHREVFRDRTEHAELPEALWTRWMAIKRPFTLVLAFGSWCSDSQHELPSFLALDGQANPFVEVHFIGVPRTKEIQGWPTGIAPEKAEKVPTAWVYALGPGGQQTLVGSVVEHPPKADETFAEAVVAVMEQVR